MKAAVLAGEETAAADEVADLRPLASDEPRSSANAIAVAACTNQAQAQPIPPVAHIVSQQRGPVVEIGNENIQVAVVVKVEHVGAAADAGHLGAERDGSERSIATIGKKVIGLGISTAAAGAVNLRIHVTVGYQQIEVAIVVKVKEPRAKAHVRPPDTPQGRFGADIRKGAVALVAIEGIVLVFKMRGEQVGPAVVVVVAPSHPHARLDLSAAAVGQAGWEGAVGKATIAAIAIKKVRARVVGYEQVGPAIGVGVRKQDAQAVAGGGVVEARPSGDVGKLVAVVAIKHVRRPGQSPRADKDLDSLPLRPQVLDRSRIKYGIARHVQVEVAIAVVVGPSRACAPMRRSHTSRCAHIGEGHAVVAKEHILPQLGRVQVWVPVVVKVRTRRPHAPAAAGGPECLAHIDKAGRTIVAEERVSAAWAINPIEVLIAIEIKVERGGAAAFGLGDIALL